MADGAEAQRPLFDEVTVDITRGVSPIRDTLDEEKRERLSKLALHADSTINGEALDTQGPLFAGYPEASVLPED